MSAAGSSFTIDASPGGFGAVITHDSLDELVAAPDFLDSIVSLVDRHLVIRVIAPQSSPDAMAKLARVFGTPTGSGSRMAGFEPLVDLVFQARPDATAQDDADMAHVMHHDAAGLDAPPAYVVTSVKTNASGAGKNSWIDMQAVYRDLSDELKHRIAGLRAVHSTHRDLVSVGAHRDLKVLPPDVRSKGPQHPLAMRNARTGKPSLFLPVRRDALIPGLDDSDALKLLTELWDIVDASAHRWSTDVKPDDVILWENFATVHDRPPFSGRASRQVWLANLRPESPAALAS